MRSPLRFLVLVVVILFSLGLHKAAATHIRAGEITARRLASSTGALRYEVRLTAYFDEVNGKDASRLQETVDFYIGSEFVAKVPRVSRAEVGNNTTKNEYVVIHTFPSANKYRISFEEDNRNNNILNIGPQPTQQLNFYVATTLEINANLGLNRTPVLLNSPIDLAAVGQRYIHNPGAFDADGDSLAYRLFIPQEGGVDGAGINLEYRHPNLVGAPGATEAGASPATFSMNRLTGDLIWDAPAVKGYYNVAFVVEEWRDGVLIGEIVRDMQIIVEDARNDRPLLQPLPDICVEAGTLINQRVTATDKNGDKLTLTSSGGVYDNTLVPPALATFNVANQGSQSTVTGQFIWQTSCNHIRFEPYNVLFKVEDGPSPTTPNPSLFNELADLTTLRIHVYGPRPTGLTATTATDPAGVAYRLNWDAYKCQVAGARIVIYRKVGCSDIPVVECLTGIPEGSGYIEIGSVGVGQRTFLDNNNGAGLQAGTTYSYRILVLFPRPGANVNEPGSLVGGGESVVSDEFCLKLPILAPVITNVTVDSTSETRGVITVKWIKPAAPSGLPAQYRLFRAVGQNGTAFTQIAAISTTLAAGAADTIFVDKALNTLSNAYNYKIEYWTTQGGKLTKMDETETASSVRLEQGAANPDQISLRWSALVPWSNNNRIHRLYREDKSKPGTFNRIAEVPVTGNQTFTFTDDGTDRYAADGNLSIDIIRDSTYCYKVETVGSYNNSQIKPAVLYNFSQILCVSSADTTRPCAPVLALDQLNCDSLNLNPDAFCGQLGVTNHLTWQYTGQACDADVSAYKIYFTRYEGDAPGLIATVTTPPSPLATSYAHDELPSFAGCYYVTALNRFGTESVPSNIVCKDNCPMYVLPNVFTPNGDNKNDVFQPYECPGFVESLEFRAFNRWGAEVFSTRDVNVNWNGKTNKGKELAAGQYYYEVRIHFESYRKQSPETILKGWVQLLR